MRRGPPEWGEIGLQILSGAFTLAMGIWSLIDAIDEAKRVSAASKVAKKLPAPKPKPAKKTRVFVIRRKVS